MSKVVDLTDRLPGVMGPGRKEPPRFHLSHHHLTCLTETHDCRKGDGGWVKKRETDSMRPVYATGFSSGGQHRTLTLTLPFHSCFHLPIGIVVLDGSSDYGIQLGTDTVWQSQSTVGFGASYRIIKPYTTHLTQSEG